MPARNVHDRSDEPQTPLDMAAAVAMDAARLSLVDDGRELDRMIVVLYSEGEPPNATVAMHVGETAADDPLDQVLQSAVQAYYKATGRTVQFVETTNN